MKIVPYQVLEFSVLALSTNEVAFRNERFNNVIFVGSIHQRYCRNSANPVFNIEQQGLSSQGVLPECLNRGLLVVFLNSPTFQ